MTQPKREKCNRGHPLTPDNVYVHVKTGNRRCRICMEACSKKWNEIRKNKRSRKNYLTEKEEDDSWMC